MSPHGEDLQPLVMLNYSHPQTTRDICLRTQSDMSSALTIFIEARSDLNTTTVGQVELDYDIQRTFSSSSYDSMEGVYTQGCVTKLSVCFHVFQDVLILFIKCLANIK